VSEAVCRRASIWVPPPTSSDHRPPKTAQVSGVARQRPSATLAPCRLRRLARTGPPRGIGVTVVSAHHQLQMSAAEAPQLPPGSPVRQRPSRQTARQIPSFQLEVESSGNAAVQRVQPPLTWSNGEQRAVRTASGNAASTPLPAARPRTVAPRPQFEGSFDSGVTAPAPVRRPPPASLYAADTTATATAPAAYRPRSSPADSGVAPGPRPAELQVESFQRQKSRERGLAAQQAQYQNPPVGAPYRQTGAAPALDAVGVAAVPYTRVARVPAPPTPPGPLLESRWESRGSVAQAPPPPVASAPPSWGTAPSNSRPASRTISGSRLPGSMEAEVERPRRTNSKLSWADSDGVVGLPTASSSGRVLAPVRTHSSGSSSAARRRIAEDAPPPRIPRSQRSNELAQAQKSVSGNGLEVDESRKPRSRSGNSIGIAAPLTPTPGSSGAQIRGSAAAAQKSGQVSASGRTASSSSMPAPQRTRSIREAAAYVKQKLSVELGGCYSSAATRAAEREEAERQRQEDELLAEERQIEADRRRAAALRADSAQRAAQQAEIQRSLSARRRAAQVARDEVSKAQATVQKVTANSTPETTAIDACTVQ